MEMQEQNALHTLVECTAWAEQRQVLVVGLDVDTLSLETMVRAMVSSGSKWDCAASFCGAGAGENSPTRVPQSAAWAPPTCLRRRPSATMTGGLRTRLSESAICVSGEKSKHDGTGLALVDVSTRVYRSNDGKAAMEAKGDLITKVTGSFGKYHLVLCLLIFLTKFPIAFHQMAILFLAPKVTYSCGESGNNTCPCSDPIYDTSLFTRSIIMEWDLICDRKWLQSFTQMLFQLGTLIGSVLFGMASDRFGRKNPLLLAVVMQISAGVAAAYVPDFWSFTFLRFLVGLSIGGTMVTGFVIVMEFVGTRYRDLISVVYQIPFNLGHMMLPAFAYFCRDYSDFQLAISVPVIILLVYFFLIPETPRWLIAMKRTDEAIKLLERIATVNKRPTENIKADVEAYQASIEKYELKKGTVLDLFRTPNLRKNILAMAFNWLACSYCFYGVSQYVGQLSGNVFINVACSASVTLLGCIAAIPLVRLIGRKTIVIVFHLMCALCLFILAAIPEGVGSVVCASIGVVASFIVFVVVYLYCTELFPTVVRNAAIGISSMAARIGSMIAPFVVESRDVALWMPPVIFAVVPLIAAFITFLLPETKGCELTTTIEEGEQYGKKIRSPVKK